MYILCIKYILLRIAYQLNSSHVWTGGGSIKLVQGTPRTWLNDQDDRCVIMTT